MSVSIPTIDLDAIKGSGDTFKGMRKALYGALSATYSVVQEFGAQLMAQRNAREKGAELFEVSTAAEDVEAREVISLGKDKIEEFNAKIAQIQSDIDALLESRIAAQAATAGLSADELAEAGDAYKGAVATLKNFHAAYPEVAAVKFPGVTQLVTGKGALRSGEATRRFRATVQYNGNTYDSISIAAQAAKVDNSVISSKVIEALGSDNELKVGQSVTVTVVDNGVDKVFVVTGKETAKPGRKAKGETASDSNDTDTEPTEAELAEAVDEFDNDSDDESDDESDDDFS